ncbi:MAG: DUF3990 domain-containing protein [Coriobacteriales bacterium]|jgi:hypothetical protein
MPVLELYHGSQRIISQPEYGAGRARNDYGRGFYCTEHLDLAREWAVGENRDGYANRYTLETEGLSFLDLNGPEYTILHWLAVLLQNRTFDIRAPLPLEAREYLIAHFPVPYEHADLIRGYRADDSYFSFAQDFLNGLISLRQLARAMHLGKLGEQVVVKSRRAFECLEFQEAVFAPAFGWYPRREARDAEARRAYFDVERNRRQPGDIYIIHILDEEVGPDDPRLR